MKQIVYLVLMVLSVVLSVTGCAPKNSFVLLKNPDGSVGQIEVKTKKGSRVISQPNYATQVSSSEEVPGTPAQMDEARIQRKFGQALAAAPEPPVTIILNFESGTNRLTDASENLIPSIMKAIRDRRSTDISVVGHTDTVGSAKDNRELAYERAAALRDILVERGVDAKSIEVASHGESNPLVPTADDVAEPKNRRVEVTVR